MKSRTLLTRHWLSLATVVTMLVCVASVSSQVQTKSTTTSHPATVETSVERGEIVYLNGNDMIVKMEDGILRHFPNVPASARAIVDGKEIGIHDAKVGMKLEKTITTTTTPKTITTVQTVTGKVWHVSPPSSVILTLEDGTNQQFKIPKGQMFNVNGEMVDAWGLKKGMNVSATKIVEVPETVVTREKSITGTAPPPPPPDQPILVAVATPPPPPSAPSAPAELPKTATLLPLIGCLGVVSLTVSISLRRFRNR